MEKYQNIKTVYPFLTLIKQGKNEYVGIVQNSTDKFITIYDLNAIKTHEERVKFLDLGKKWYWESNRQLPINIFLFDQMTEFNYSIKTLLLKECIIEFGPVTSLENIIKKRVKKKTIQLVRRVN